MRRGTDWHDISWKIDLYIRSKATFITNICGILTIFLFNHSLNKQEKIAISRRPNSGRDFANASTECNEIYDVWENHNILTQQGVFILTQRLKYSFVCNLSSWVRVFIVLSPFYLVSFFYWLGSNKGRWSVLFLSSPLGFEPLCCFCILLVYLEGTVLVLPLFV